MIKRFTKGDHSIFHGDIVEVLKSSHIKNGTVDLIFADPPYNIGKNFNGRKDRWSSRAVYMKWCKEWLELAIAKLKPTGSMYVMAATQFFPDFDLLLRSRIEILSRIVWAYDSSGVQAKNNYGSLYEPILYCVKDKYNYVFNSQDILITTKTGAERRLIDYRSNPPKPYNNTKVPGNVWHFSRVRYRMEEYEVHPTQKPKVLLERIIKASSRKKSLVLDLFAGTFTTSTVAKEQNRKSIAIEIDEDFVKIGLRRLEIRRSYKFQKLEKQKKPYIKKNKKSEDENVIISKGAKILPITKKNRKIV